MATGSQYLTTYYAKRIIGDNAAADHIAALLQTGAHISTDTWILNRTNRLPQIYGIKYKYDTTTTNDVNNGHDKIEFYGNYQVNEGTEESPDMVSTPTAWIQLDVGDFYILGNAGFGASPDGTHQLYVYGDTKLYGNVGIGTDASDTYKLYVNGTGYFSNNLTTAMGLYASAIELSSATPYIDFHFNSSSADYTSRIIESASGYLQIPGSFGVGGQNTSYKFYVNGTSYLKGDTTIVGNVSFGASNTSNYISIHGLTGDAADTQWANHYFIGNRHWGSTESSELVLFAGNDIGNGDNANTASGSGPDRIRYIGGAHLFQTYSSAVSGTFETVCTSSALVNILEVNTNRLFSYKNFVFNDAEIGIRRAGRSVAWVTGRNSAIVRETSSPGYHACISIKTTNGSWDIGAYDNSSYTDKLIFSYATDANYNSGNNTSSAYTITTGGYFSGSCASSAACTGNAATATALTSNAGNANTPVYFTGGKPSACNNKLGAQSANGYWGMGSADNAFNVWIRTTTQGIIPYQSGGAGSGHCGLGTNTWYFSYSYIDTMYSVNTVSSSCLCVSQTAGTGAGLSLYAGTNHVQNYGIWCGVASSWGNHGAVTNDWNMYFSMAGNAARGWVFRHASTGCVASVNGSGCISAGYRTATNISAHRLCLIPPYHTGGPWYIDAYDPNASQAYCDVLYNTTHVFQIRHDGHVYASAAVHNAVWNDLAECRRVEECEPGHVVIPTDNKIAQLTTSRLQPGARIVSDTYGMCMGESDISKTPVALAGKVLAYTYRKKEEYKIGNCVCSAPNGTVDIMTREEIKEYPDCIIGTVYEIPDYEIWEESLSNANGSKSTASVKVNGRIWIDIK